ncbi:hypothetical protein NPIL_190201 [Nephila pilipes]|uniref:SAP domain-containing protein n=1 Tax=Nephila pilipes TaxID=299642 RepID=A0A8X6N666_NEPPI|nr:hypothetical protein NPIL_190201 [Nephila pilipes]
MADFDIESVSGLRVIELREQLSNRGLPTTGLKEELVKRLRESEQSIREAVGEKEQAREERKSESEINLNQLLAAMMDMNSNLKEMKADKVDKNEERLGKIEKNIEKNEERFG